MNCFTTAIPYPAKQAKLLSELEKSIAGTDKI